MEIDNINVPQPSVLVAAVVEAAASEEIIQPLFSDSVTQVEEVPSEEAVSKEETTEEETTGNDENAEEETASEEESESDDSTESSASEQGLNPAPSDMRQWIDDIDNIEYHYRHDDDDRGYNFFRDNAGNTLMIQEFDVNGERFFNINREIIIKQSEFFSLHDAIKTPDGVNATIFGQKLLRGCSTDLLVEALTILGENGSDTSSEEEEEPQPQPSPIPTKGDADAIQRFLFSCFLVLIFLKFFGCITKFA